MSSANIAASRRQFGKPTVKRFWNPCGPVRCRKAGRGSLPLSMVLCNREGIDKWHAIPARLRRSLGRKIAPVRSGSGVIEKNIEVHITRRFKRQGRSWSRNGTEHLAQLLAANQPT